MGEVVKVCKKVCDTCKWRWGNSKSDNLTLTICGYYNETGKHRCDDFGRPKKNNEWLERCDKYEKASPEQMAKRKGEQITFTRKGKQIRAERSIVKEIMGMKFKNISICQNCGSTNIATSDSRNVDGKKIRMRICKNCGIKFRTIEVLADDLIELAKEIEVEGN